MAAAAAWAALLGLGGMLIEPLAARGVARRRLVWCAVVILAVAVPLALALVPADAGVPAAPAGTGASAPTGVAWRLSSDVVVASWVALSLLVAVVLARSYVAVWRDEASWTHGELFGLPVRISRDFGPAILGFVRPRVVIPAWAMELPEADQRLIVAHESHHLTAHDQWLLLLGLGTVILMPWNPALWYALKRLRDGIELDCDCRVAGPSDVERYCRVLLEARGRGTVRLGVSLALMQPALTTRIEALLVPRRISGARMTLRAGGAMLCLLVAALVPVPRLSAARSTVTAVSAGRTVPAIAMPSPTPAGGAGANRSVALRGRPRARVRPSAPAVGSDSMAPVAVSTFRFVDVPELDGVVPAPAGQASPVDTSVTAGALPPGGVLRPAGPVFGRSVFRQAATPSDSAPSRP